MDFAQKALETFSSIYRDFSEKKPRFTLDLSKNKGRSQSSLNAAKIRVTEAN
jgi:hypothetical protein